MIPAATQERSLVRLAKFLLHDQAPAEQVVRDVLAGSPPQDRDAVADRKAVVIRCRTIRRGRGGTS
jgi:hypothetical protein